MRAGKGSKKTFIVNKSVNFRFHFTTQAVFTNFMNLLHVWDIIPKSILTNIKLKIRGHKTSFTPGINNNTSMLEHKISLLGYISLWLKGNCGDVSNAFAPERCKRPYLFVAATMVEILLRFLLGGSE